MNTLYDVSEIHHEFLLTRELRRIMGTWANYP